MPLTADLVIIGGGVHGASLAYHLGKARIGNVVLVEKGYVASGPTGKSGAMIRPLFTEKAYVELVVRSTRMFEAWDDLIGGNAGFVQNGFLRITPSLDPDVLGANLSLVGDAEEPYSILNDRELSELVPAGEFCDGEQGVLLPKAGFADPTLTTLQLIRAAQQLGVTLMEKTAVVSIEVQKDRVRSVHTDQGRIDAPAVVNCAGCWSQRIARMVGIDLPITVQRTPTCLFRRPESIRREGPTLSDGVNRIYARNFGDWFLRTAHFGWTPDPADPDDYDETVSMSQINVLRNGLHRRYEAMQQSVFYGGFSALYDMTPDGHPIVGPHPQVEGFWLNCGWSGNGFASAPAVGDCLGQMIKGENSEVDLSLFAWPRGSAVRQRADMQWVFR